MRSQKKELMRFLCWKTVFRFVPLLFLGACTGCTSNEVEFKITPKEQAIEKPSLVKLYMETSASMKGYVNYNETGDYKLKDALSYFITDVTENGPSIELYTITDAAKRYDRSVSEFEDDLRTGDIFSGKSSMLHNIFKMLIKEVDSASVNILVSDCILDLGTESNMSERSQMTLEIYRQLNPNISAACFKFLSDFNGDWYYDRENTGGLHSAGVKKPYAGKILHERPFYIWMFGNGNLIKKIHEDGSLKGYESAHFYNINYNETPVSLLSYPRKGKIASINVDEKKFIVREASAKRPAEITIGLNLSTLPNSYKNKGYLEKNLSVRPDHVGDYCEVQLITLEELSGHDDYSKVASVVGKEGLTHFVTLRFTALPKEYESFELVFSKEKPAWLADSHLDDDLNMPADSIEGKTFSFGQLIDAFDRRYTDDELLMVEFSINDK